MTYLIRLFFCSILLIIFGGCYCTQITFVPHGADHPRWIRGIKMKTMYHLCFGNGKSNQVNVYYGFPSDLKSKLYESYNINGTTDYKFENNGQYGIRFEKYISPGFTPFNVLGIGLDYSYSNTMITFNSTTDSSSFDNKLSFGSNRIALSGNLFTLITRGRLLGYVSAQIGTLNYSKSYQGSNPNFEFTDPLKTGSFDYRLGYGFQFFPSSSLGVSFEGGYGRGAYLRAGLVLWF